MTTPPLPPLDALSEDAKALSENRTLKYSLLGPSLTKAGQDTVDQSKVSEIIYNASKGSKFFNREEERDKILTKKIEQILGKKQHLEKQDLSRELRHADQLITQLELSRDLTQYIVHVDCDAFYAAVELLDRPELRDVPFAVGGGVLTTCNYVARKYGCRSGMAGFVAKKLCPDLVMLKLNFEKYTAKAHEVREVLVEYDPRFESASIDEAYLNVTEYCIDKGIGPAEAVEQMRREIHEKTNITVSAGIAANAKLAKICSNMNKPNGQFVLPNDRSEILRFMAKLPPRKVNGVGRVLERQLAEIGIKTCADLYPQRQFLRPLFGDKAYEFLINVYLGLGRTRIQPAEEYERKSPWAGDGLDEDGWEQWPEEELLGLDDDQYLQPDLYKGSASLGDDEPIPVRRHGKEIQPNPVREYAPVNDEMWDCPICNRPQAPDERGFNEHIDLCLSRQTIREAVHGMLLLPQLQDRQHRI
ncbi:impB/mucB/samB family protein [Colletotrichum tofieldiae]|nr:impB/mucB/samB family protein [Colletotrichum tofieldiae]